MNHVVKSRRKQAGVSAFTFGPSGSRFGYESDFAAVWDQRGRLFAGLLGGFFLIQGFRSRGLPRLVFATLGVGGFLRAFANADLPTMVGTVTHPVIRLRRTIYVDAPSDEVFAFWKDFSNYPKFMSYIQKLEVSELGDLMWLAKGPNGLEVRWHSSVGPLNPNQMIAWKSKPGALIANSGVVQVFPEGEERTRVGVELSYAPPVGAIGYAVAHILGFDPRLTIDQDLLTMKDLIERQWEPVRRDKIAYDAAL